MKKVAVISLGCDKNRVDTEHILYRICRGGYDICDIGDAEIIIINTCAFIESARQESIDTILSCAELKKTGKCKKLIVTGCLPQKYRGELIAELPEVDAFVCPDEYGSIADVLGGGAPVCCEDFDSRENCGRMLTTYPHVAYIKIAEGCGNHCTFCAIPSIRGKYRSRTVDDIVAEAAGLVKDGVKELILVAQDVTRFGCDRGASDLITLLDRLEELPLYTVRLLYCYPEMVTDELIDKIAASDKIAKYIDIPVQHCADGVLKRMNRRTDGNSLRSLIAKLHARGIVVRTTLMVGFPGESESDFEALCEFVRSTKPEYAGVFAYSKEDGTAAARLPGHIKKSEKRRRADILGGICGEVTREFNRSLVGSTVEVIYEDIDYDRNMFIGRARFQTPDVDGRVLFVSDKPVDAGGIYRIKITKSDDYDVYGEVSNE